MILTGQEIKKRLGTDIILEPFNEKQLNPNSYNLKLHNELYVYTNKVLDMKKDNPARKIIIPEEGFMLEPNKLYLGRTVEMTETHRLVPILSGRSSTGRLGLHCEISAGFGDTGFKGHWTLEISCIQPVIIYPFVEMCQVYYNEIIGDITEYEGKYCNNTDIQASMMYKDFEK